MKEVLEWNEDIAHQKEPLGYNEGSSPDRRVLQLLVLRLKKQFLNNLQALEKQGAAKPKTTDGNKWYKPEQGEWDAKTNTQH